MQISNGGFEEVGSQLILPLFEGNNKPPNNSLAGLGRSQRKLVKEALSSGEFDAKKGKRMTIWTLATSSWLVVGVKNRLGNEARNSARIASMSKKKGSSNNKVHFRMVNVEW